MFSEASLASLIETGRAAAAVRMSDECNVVRPGVATSDRDPVTGAIVPVPDVPVYSGPCRLKTARVANDVASEVGGDFPVSNNSTFSVPVGAAVFQNLDVVYVTASKFEPWLVGKRFRITTPNLGSQRSADRWQVEVITG